ncbi:MAG TPA: hypothetical protein VLG71_01370 [Candidatus Limnocylindria bacterium]|nr:hypothetical protein [Candidatus Limnocylindria bacterium]
MQKILFSFLFCSALSFFSGVRAQHQDATQQTIVYTAPMQVDFDDVYAAYEYHAQEQGTVFAPPPPAWWQIAGAKVAYPLYKRCFLPVKNGLAVLYRALASRLRRSHANH